MTTLITVITEESVTSDIFSDMVMAARILDIKTEYHALFGCNFHDFCIYKFCPS